MKTSSKKVDGRLGEFVACAYSVYFPFEGDYKGGVEVDHCPIVRSKDFDGDRSMNTNGCDDNLSHDSR